jgi:hypothetical protein
MVAVAIRHNFVIFLKRGKNWSSVKVWNKKRKNRNIEMDKKVLLLNDDNMNAHKKEWTKISRRKREVCYI